MGKPAARISDAHICPEKTGHTPHIGGPVVMGVPTVFVGGALAATIGSICECNGPPDTIVMGSASVFIGGKPAARMGDSTAHGGVIVMGCPTVLIGDGGGVKAKAASVVIPKECSFLDPSNQLMMPPQAYFDAVRRPASMSAPIEAKAIFPGEKTEKAAVQQVVIVGKKSINLIYPKDNLAADKNATLAAPEQIKNSLSILPDKTLDSISTVVLSPNQNPDDSYWAKEYNRPDFRSAATGGGSGVVTYYPSTFKQPQSDIDRIMAHEAGHTYSIPLWQKVPEEKRAWENAATQDLKSPSKYATSSVDEDFSESHAMYIASKGTSCESTAKDLYPNRYAELEKMYSIKEQGDPK